MLDSEIFFQIEELPPVPQIVGSIFHPTSQENDFEAKNSAASWFGRQKQKKV